MGKLKVARAALVVLVMGVMVAGPVYAASNHAISGTVYSGCSGNGPWYTSSVARTKAGSGAIKAKFSEINDGGLTFKILDRFNSQIGVTQSWTKTEINVWRTFASSVNDGRVFYNSFRNTNYSCPDNQDNYNFAGTEYY